MAERADVGRMLADERYVYDDLSPVRADDPYTPHTFVWFHRELRDEVPVPGRIDVLHRDDRLVVVDKPPFLSTIPRGQHVQQSVVVRLRAELDLPELTPVHRLDRVTSGVLVLATERRWRGAYQQLFAERRVEKTYLALAPHDPDLALPITVRDHLRKDRGTWQATVVPDAPPNAETRVELDTVLGPAEAAGMTAGTSAGRDAALAVYRLTPATGRTHQLRVHLWRLGIPIVDDPLYPQVRDVAIDDFSAPLQLLAHRLALVDPVDGTPREFLSRRALPLLPEDGMAAAGPAEPVG